MKFSRYNSIVTLTGKYKLLYNALYDEYVVFDSLLDTAKWINEDLSVDSAQIPDSFRRKAEEGKCLIADEVDELQEFKERVKEIEQNQDMFLLTINPTVNCNFRCWYCYEDHIKGTYMDGVTLHKVMNLIDTVIDDNKELKYFSLSFFGGEPLLYYKQVVKPLIVHFRKACEQNRIGSGIGFTSNGYLLTSEMIGFFKEQHIESFQITLDGCREEHNQVRFGSGAKGSYDKILDNVKLLLDAHIYVSLRINYTAKNILKIKNVLKDIEDITSELRHFLNINFQRVWQDENNAAGIEEIIYETLESFRRKGFSVSKRHSDYLRQTCYADKKNQAVINYNGDVFKCTARDFRPERREGFLNENGEIIWENDALEKRMSTKFRNKPCLHCRIAPICNGGCTQQALEHDKEYCMTGFSEQKKDEIILDRFCNRFVD